ncbi:thioredoxin domain-containing protein [Sulfitobacter sp. 1A13353]|uniref:thioredoxin domain-containing protein n=1 Tax=Sulfitobacter sp. 1A13353 TaxID=3368568 RepID=UPI0037453A05
MTAGTGLAAMGRKPDAGEAALPRASDSVVEIPDMILGDPAAPVEIIEYASFTCSHCARFQATVKPRLVAEQIETGQAKFIFREVYFDRPGIWASLMARAAGANRFFAVSDLLYERQRDWLSGDPAEIARNLRKIGKIAGMQEEALEEAFSDADKAEALVAWQETNLARDGVNATPTVFVDGKRISAWDYESIVSAM